MARRGDNIHKRKDGRWEGRYKNGYRSDGSVRYSSVYATTYSECKRKLINAQSDTGKVNNVLGKDKLFSDILHSWMYSNRIRIKGATEAKYIRLIESHIIPALGGIKIRQLDSNKVNVFLDSKLKSGGLKSKDALSPSYVRTMAIIIEAAINYAVMERLCDPLRTPINKPSVPKKDIVILSKRAEISCLLSPTFWCKWDVFIYAFYFTVVSPSSSTVLSIADSSAFDVVERINVCQKCHATKHTKHYCAYN